MVFAGFREIGAIGAKLMEAVPHRWTRTEILRVENWIEEGKTPAYMARCLKVSQAEVESVISVLQDKLIRPRERVFTGLLSKCS